MKVVYKYRLEPGGFCLLAMPQAARLLCVQVQGDLPTVWALVDPKQPTVARKITILATGEPVKDDLVVANYIGSFQLASGALVFHAFDRGEDPNYEWLPFQGQFRKREVPSGDSP